MYWVLMMLSYLLIQLLIYLLFGSELLTIIPLAFVLVNILYFQVSDRLTPKEWLDVKQLLLLLLLDLFWVWSFYQFYGFWAFVRFIANLIPLIASALYLHKLFKAQPKVKIWTVGRWYLGAFLFIQGIAFYLSGGEWIRILSPICLVGFIWATYYLALFPALKEGEQRNSFFIATIFNLGALAYCVFTLEPSEVSFTLIDAAILGSTFALIYKKSVK